MSQKILVETSARHVHVTQEVLEALFGAGHQLVSKKDLPFSVVTQESCRRYN